MLEAQNISKTFGGVQALSSASFSLLPGEIHAIMGENGAGKSTLGKILAGVFPASSGTLSLHGKLFQPSTPRDAQAAGVAMIFQELDLFPNLSVAENIVAANLAFPEGLFARRGQMDEFCKPVLQQVDLHCSPRTRVDDLSIGDQQRVAIARALSMNAKILVMDESTSSLTEDAVATLFDVMRALKATGVSIIYVSHKMDEIFTICDRITVLRDGYTVGTSTSSETDMPTLISQMVGRDVDTSARAASHASDKIVLKMESVTTSSLHGVSLDVREGEVLGIAGLVGAGRTEIGRAILGMDPLSLGALELNGSVYDPKSVSHAVRNRIAMLPEDRKLMGLMMQMSVRENGSLAHLPRMARNGWIRRDQERSKDEDMAKRTRLKSASPELPVSHLSGGNQQKVLLGRWLMVEPQLFFLDDPTRGVDVGAKQDIYAIIESLAADGCALMMVSSELTELLRCCDRIAIMNQGHLVDIVDARTTDQETIMHKAATPVGTLMNLLRYKEWIVLIGMVILATVLTNGLFIDPANLTDMLRSISPIAIMAMAMTFVILTAGIDLSVGSILALTSVGSALLLTDIAPELSTPLLLLLVVSGSLIVGGLLGALQGGLIAKLDIQPFIITLAGMIGFRGVAKLWSQNNRIGLGVDRESSAYAFGEFFSTKPVMIGTLVVVAILSHILLKYTVFGRNVRAVGDNERAAHYAGLPVARIKCWVYTLSGMMAGLAGLMLAARTRNGDANAGVAYELDAIAMVVIGGTSLAGGKGSIGGTVLGALIMGTVINVLGLKNVDANLQLILKAVIIVVAVALQVNRRKD